MSVRLDDGDRLFVHVPKTAGGSISRALLERADATPHGVTAMAEAVPAVRQLETQLGELMASFDTVACVRNPWDWTVSGWLHVTQNRPAYIHPPTFRDFVLGDWRGATILQYPHKFTSPAVYVEYHTQITQWQHLSADGVTLAIDHIIRYESLDEDIVALFGDDLALPHVNRSDDRAHYSEYYDDETQSVVADRNAALIKRFGYEFATARVARCF